MNSAYVRIGAAAAKLAKKLPYSVMSAVAASVESHRQLDFFALRQAVLQNLPSADFRDAAGEFFDLCSRETEFFSANAAMMALVTAAESEREHRRRESVELVWTGPEPEDSRLRQTEQALLEVLNSAKKRLTVVSYAVYRIPQVRNSLIEAVQRGVEIRLIVETPNLIEGQGEYDCLMALGQNVASACSVFYWPQEKRASDNNGKLGILHVKCVVADGTLLFISSANMTEYAFTINMELGCLISGGVGPAQVERHFDRLIEGETIVSLRPRF